MFYNGVEVFKKVTGPEVALFYAGLVNGTLSNATIRLNVDGAQVGSVTNVGTSRELLAGTGLIGVAVFYGGWVTNVDNIVTRINSDATLVGAQTFIGTKRFNLAGGDTDNIAVFYAGVSFSATNVVTRINDTGVLEGNETNIATARLHASGAGVNNAMFTAGILVVWLMRLYASTLMELWRVVKLQQELLELDIEVLALVKLVYSMEVTLWKRLIF